MVQFPAKFETLRRAAILAAVALTWCLCAYVVFVTSEPVDSTLGLADVDLSKPAAAFAIYERVRNAAAIWAGGRKWVLNLSAWRLRG